MLLRFLSLLGATITVLAHFSDAGSLPSVSAPIYATATVAEPMGMITAPLIDELTPFGVDPANNSPRILLVSRSRGVTIDLDGVPIALPRIIDPRAGFVSTFDPVSLPINQSVTHPAILTIIYSEN